MKKNNANATLAKKAPASEEILVEIMERFAARTFDEKVLLFGKMREHMKQQFEEQYKAHEERAAWMKHAYENLMKG